MRQCVLDCNIAVKIWLNEPESEIMLDWLQRELALPAEERIQCQVPEFFYAEVANVLWKKATRTKVMPIADVLPSVRDLEQLSLFVPNPVRPLIARSTDLALRYYDLAVYDACYLTLAEFHDCLLVTADEHMRNILTGSPHEPLLTSLANFIQTV